MEWNWHGCNSVRGRVSSNNVVNLKCPNCETTIYSRVHRLCRACGFALPAELLLTDAEIHHFEEKMREEKNAQLEVDQDVASPTFSGTI
jgi:predicted RNA-binding Zn-ribbon protein involved in translation (DUF1610 family)